MSNHDEDADEYDSQSVQIGLQRVVEGEFAPTDFVTAPGDDRKYIVDQPG